MSTEDEKTTAAMETAPEISTDNEKSTAEKMDTTPTYTETPGESALARPPGWRYKERKLGSVTIPWYASPKVQLIMVSFVCFLCPGMYNALNGMGAGGQLNATAADNANTALYSTFAGIGFFAGTFANRLGIRLTLSFGGIGYSIYTASLLCYTHTSNQGFVIFAGALLGLCAALLWTAQGAIMMSYPHEEEKGRYISWFWIIFNLGAVIGGLLPLGMAIDSEYTGTVADGTYIGFIVLMAAGAVLALFLCDASAVIREDGSKVILMKNPTWWSEIKGLGVTLITDKFILLLFPMFFSSNWFTTYQFNAINGSHFNVRTRALNSTLYWIAQMLGALVFGYALDYVKVSRPQRARGALIALFVLTFVIWGGGYAWQKQADPRSVTGADGYEGMDWTDSGYVGVMFLYIFYGFYDASWQTCSYWFMGALSNSSRKTANYAGFYKGIQSAGAAITWRMDALGVSYMSEFASCWALLAGSLVIASPVIWLKIYDHTSVEKDIAFSDETIAEVMPGEKKGEVAV